MARFEAIVFLKRGGRVVRGFTLIEVLVALTVLAIAMGAVMGSLTQGIDLAVEMRQRTIAIWVGQDRLVKHRLEREWPSIDTTDHRVTMLGIEWRLQEKVSGTQEPTMRRIDIDVRGPDSQHVLAHVTGFLKQP